jgi:phosphoserine phosphatase RsbU/P
VGWVAVLYAQRSERERGGVKRQSRFQRFRSFVGEYTAGLDVRKAPAELGRDASRAYSILTRDHAAEAEPAGRLRRLWHRARIVFLGLSYKLSPTRRILFVFCLVVATLGLLQLEAPVRNVGPTNPTILIAVAITGLVFLLGLELADRVLVRDELEVARQLQHDLLPTAPPDIAGYTFGFSYRTANEIGGDYHDFLPLSDGRWAVVIGDASGHGIAAGLLMAIARTTLQLAIGLDPRPLAVLDLMNRALLGAGGSRAFMTMFYGVLEPSSGRLEYACAGHPYPLLRNAAGEVVELGSGCLPLGLRTAIAPTPGTAHIIPGDLLVMYTDGVPETVNARGDAFGFDRVRRAVATGGSASVVHDRIVEAVDSFAGNTPLHDDRSLVIISRQA